LLFTLLLYGMIMNQLLHFSIDSGIEAIAAILAVLGVILSKQRSVWCWSTNIVSSILYGYVFLQAGLFADGLLQGVFVCLSLYGWVEWKINLDTSAFVEIERITRMGWLWSMLATTILTIVIWKILIIGTPSDVPVSDALTTAMSLVGIWLQTRRALENWLWWIAADILYVGLYMYKGLYMTAVLYALFVVLAWQGWQAWRSALQQSNMND
jgi:nicotinamide mononucleotide transporter